jgi:diguanylate cyclase (GGDEF)-like protein
LARRPATFSPPHRRNRREHGPIATHSPRTLSLGRAEARVRAFELIQAVQIGDTEAPVELAALVAQTQACDWSELVRIGMFGRAVEAWTAGESTALAAHLYELIALSRAAGDQCLSALGLAMRAAFVIDGSLGAGAPTFDGDLAEAMVLLERSGGGALEMISALTACGIAFDYRSLWELSEEVYAAALSLEPEAATTVVGLTLLAAVMFNRAEAQVGWAGRLRQINDTAAIEERLQTWPEVVAAVERFGVPEAWKPELVALGLLMEALAGRDVTEAAERALAAPDGFTRPSGHLELARAFSIFTTRGAAAGPDVSRALAAIDAEIFPQLHELALYLAAEVEAVAGPSAGARYARFHIERRWADRLTQLGAMRSRISAERMRAELERVSSEVSRDDLTGIGNRRALTRYTADLRRSDVKAVAVLMIDLDAFKAINDRYGHGVGDAVLSRIASILAASVRPTDLAIRLGGDEFLVILPGVDEEVAIQRAAALTAAVAAQPWPELGPGLSVAASIGVAVGPLDDFDSVRARADRAVYRAKRSGGGIVDLR